MDSRFTLHGTSQRAYTFDVCDMNQPFRPIAGLYVFASRMRAGGALLYGQGVVPAYIGQASNLADRLRNHEVWPRAQRMGALLVLAMAWPGNEQTRLAAELDLIRRHNPTLNTAGRTGRSLLGDWPKRA